MPMKTFSQMNPKPQRLKLVHASEHFLLNAHETKIINGSQGPVPQLSIIQTRSNYENPVEPW
jgi:hypothetical protein